MIKVKGRVREMEVGLDLIHSKVKQKFWGVPLEKMSTGIIGWTIP